MFKFLQSLYVYLQLAFNGFNISKAKLSSGMIIHRFWFNDNMISTMPDIDLVSGRYYKMFKGRSASLELVKKYAYDFDFQIESLTSEEAEILMIMIVDYAVIHNTKAGVHYCPAYTIVGPKLEKDDEQT